MKALFALFALLTVAAASLVPDHQLDDEWEAFKFTYEKDYDGHETESFRRAIWEKNYHRIIIHNSEANNGLKTFWLGMNEYADMDGTEFVRMMNGLVPRNLTRNKPKFVFGDEDVSDLPNEINWVYHGYVTDVKDQRRCCSGWAFSATGSLEGQHFRKTKDLIPLSEQQLVDCSTKCRNMGCNGGLMEQAFECIKGHGGIMSEADYPYEGKDGRCLFDKSKVVATVTGYVDVESESEAALQRAVATIGPISVAIDASHFSFQLYSHGVYKEERCSTTKLDHGVLAVGYGTQTGKGYWLVKNSWGPRWGLYGYIKMARNFNNMCGIATQASFPLV